MVWQGANYPQEYEVDAVNPNDLEPVGPEDLIDPWNVKVEVIAERLNDLLMIVQQQHDEITVLRRQVFGDD